jgi:hypothetical protein
MKRGQKEEISEDTDPHPDSPASGTSKQLLNPYNIGGVTRLVSAALLSFGQLLWFDLTSS